ncbi:MAG TPA: TIGR00341 family protein [Thermomonas sp.]|uniref:TIGR00341 family protein n=1 Tax=Thermomonas beijingensis TaxID=2872701 RepID=A0ABS7TAD0_9GAMM|nr:MULTISPECIES: TIGR00341 family protein [Thermomonas]MBZ4184811.1 TIGR00341 family protein [Thermomonas beijingensis]HOV96986.1 TIGR00341 family protein [Thermomonas sp.]
MATTDTSQPQAALGKRLRQVAGERFNLRDDKADDEEIEARIRDAVELRGATPWILVFAILVASVGLNVNSTAVIIGAMLISPLMAPIMGAGFGVAVYDFALVKRSLTNLLIATLISLVVSWTYFSLTPLHQAQSELLARTSPTLWDVLIALFGGLAGIIGMTRKEKSNVIPGVAIATALMPPVCTAGYGLATGQWSFFGGALYLYTINCVFITLATILGIRALRLKRHGFASPAIARRVKIALWTLALATALPSIYLAINLVRQEVYRATAREFVNREFVFRNSQVVDAKIDPAKRTIDISLIGEPLSTDMQETIKAHLAIANLAGTQIFLHQSGDHQIDVTALKSTLLSDLLRESQDTVKQRESQLQKLRAELAKRNALLNQTGDISSELRQLYPSLDQITVGDGVTIAEDGSRQQVVYLNATIRSDLSAAEQQRIADWFKIRTKADAVVFNIQTPEVAAPAKASGKRKR